MSHLMSDPAEGMLSPPRSLHDEQLCPAVLGISSNLLKEIRSRIAAAKGAAPKKQMLKAYGIWHRRPNSLNEYKVLMQIGHVKL